MACTNEAAPLQAWPCPSVQHRAWPITDTQKHFKNEGKSWLIGQINGRKEKYMDNMIMEVTLGSSLSFL